MFSEPPSYVEVSIVKWIAKWIMLPIALVFFVIFGYDSLKLSNKCKELCRQQGYLKHEIVSKGKFSGTKCVCTERIDAAGNVDKKVRLEIDLN